MSDPTVVVVEEPTPPTLEEIEWAEDYIEDHPEVG